MKDKTEERKNRFNGESVMLTKEEAKKHDQIFIDEIQATIEDKTLGTGGSKHWDSMRTTARIFLGINRGTRPDPEKVNQPSVESAIL